MAKDKKSFLVYCDLIHTVKKMKKEDAGELFLHLLEYTNDLNPETDNMIVDIVFEPIKQQLKRDLVAYDTIVDERSLNGRMGNLKRWHNDLFIQVTNKTMTLKEAENIAIDRKVSPPDPTRSTPIANIAVTDTVTVTGKDTVIPKVSHTPTVNWEALLKQFNTITGKNLKVVDDKAKRQFLARLKEGYTKVDIVNAITNCFNSEFHKGNGHKNLTLEFISRPDKFAMYFDFKEIINKPLIKQQERL
jgi:hypothetical protein